MKKRRDDDESESNERLKRIYWSKSTIICSPEIFRFLFAGMESDAESSFATGLDSVTDESSSSSKSFLSLFSTDVNANHTSTTFAAAASAVVLEDSAVQGQVQAVQSDIGLTALYSLTTFFSIVGNVLVIVVFTAGRRSRTDVRWFLINLATSDLVMAVFCMPFTFTMTMLGHWVFSAPMCPVVLYLQTVSVSASVYTNTAIGIDRFWAVGYPLKSRLMARSRSWLIIAVVWAAALVLSSVQLVVGRSNKFQMSPDGIEVMDCNEVWPEPSAVWRRAYTFFLLATTYAIPLAILIFTYSFVCHKLWRRTAPGNADHVRDLQQLNSKRKVIKMLIVVVSLFGVCWLPLHVFFIVIDFHPELVSYENPQSRAVFVTLYYCVHWLAMSNSFVNPVIYGLFNDSFRNDLKWLFLKCISCAPRRKKCLCKTVVASVRAARRCDAAAPGAAEEASTPTSFGFVTCRHHSQRWLHAAEGSSCPAAAAKRQLSDRLLKLEATPFGKEAHGKEQRRLK